MRIGRATTSCAFSDPLSQQLPSFPVRRSPLFHARHEAPGLTPPPGAALASGACAAVQPAVQRHCPALPTPPRACYTAGPSPAPGALTEHEVVWPEYLAEGPGAHRVHGAGLQVHQDGAGHVLATCKTGRGRDGGGGAGRGRAARRALPVASL